MNLFIFGLHGMIGDATVWSMTEELVRRRNGRKFSETHSTTTVEGFLSAFSICTYRITSLRICSSLCGKLEKSVALENRMEIIRTKFDMTDKLGLDILGLSKRGMWINVEEPTFSAVDEK